MIKLSKLTIGSENCPYLATDFIDRLTRAIAHAKEDNEHFGWKLETYGVSIIDGDCWLVGYKKSISLWSPDQRATIEKEQKQD